MSEFFGMFKKDSKASKLAISQIIKRLETFKIPVRVEIENSYVFFRTVVSTREGMLMMAKPENLGERVKKGMMLRFSPPDEVGKEIRMEVLHSHVNLSNGVSVIVCKMPSLFAETARRSVRVDTSRWLDLNLEFPEKGDSFRIMDISNNGVKVNLPIGDLKLLMPLGEELGGAVINIKGNKIALAKLVPRVYKGRDVGCEMAVSSEGSNIAGFNKVMGHLEVLVEKRMLAAG